MQYAFSWNAAHIKLLTYQDLVAWCLLMCLVVQSYFRLYNHHERSSLRVMDPKKFSSHSTVAENDADHDQGLCVTCIHRDACTYRQKQGEPVIYCEEFSDQCPPDRRVEPPRKPSSPIQQRFKGLCMNCEHRLHCLRARSEEGVWHCEEYA